MTSESSSFVCETDGERLDKVIAARLPHISRRRIRVLLSEGGVELDGRPCRVASRTVPRGAEIFVRGEGVRGEHTERPSEEPLPPVLFEDDDLLVVDKRPGTHVNRTHTNERRSLEERLADRGVRVVHRLDLETSGVLVFARTAEAARCLSEAFRARTIEKEYWALVQGEPESQTIDQPVGRDHRRPRARAVVPDGQPAVTELSRLASLGGVSALSLRPVTGRTHQIRVHLSHIGAPILGDVLYGASGAIAWNRETIRPSRVMLHARRLELPAVCGGHKLVAPLPPDFREWSDRGLAFDASNP